jgi:hypothetical protein
MGSMSGHPALPAGTSLQEVVAIVTVHDPSAPWINAESPFPKTDHLTGGNVSGVNIFLTHVANQPCYRFGRAMATRSARQRVQDVYLPSSVAAMRQCIMMPDWERNYWRVQSTSEIIAHVNGAPIQSDAPNTKKLTDRLPTTVYLKQGFLNEITVKGCRVEICLMKSVRDVIGPLDYEPPKLDSRLQNVAHRAEQWAVDRFIMTHELVSCRTVRVYDGFTGETKAAKLFRSGHDRKQMRDREFLAFAKQDTDASIVRYQQMALVNNIPAIIMDQHVGFVPYSAVRDSIHKSHPGIRFSIASKVMLRLFPALAWMHFHGIIHEHVSHDNVLVRLVDQKAEHVMLTDYSTARQYIPAMSTPVKDMLTGGQATMKLIEDCCDIWTFRNGPTAIAEGEWKLEQRTLEAMRLHQMIKRCSADFVRRGGSQNSPKGLKLNRLQNKYGNTWNSAKAAQEENLLRKEVAHLSKSKIDAKIKEWESVNPPQTSVYKQYMILTLGHEVLDDVVNQLHVKPWDTMPQEVCAAIKQAGGSIEEPWDTFAVQKTITIESTNDAGYAMIMTWLATCCEVHPEWCEHLKAESETHMGANAEKITQVELQNLHHALQAHSQLPATMTSMFQRFVNMTEVPSQLEELYQVWYHIPSRMFNLTQLQRLATPECLAMTIREGQTRFDDFVEVRGAPEIEGCYAPLSLLVEFTEQLGLRLPETPTPPSEMPTFDPADFSQVPYTRIVLARPGLLGFGTMLRTGDQANFLYSRNNPKFITPSAFIHTYFGDMRVLPNLLQTGLHSYERPEHWSKYKTAAESEAAADRSKRSRLQATGPGSSTPRAGGASSQVLPRAMEVEETTLGKLLHDRERIRNDAPLPLKRWVPEPSGPSPKRARGRLPSPPPKEKVRDVTLSFAQRMDDAMQRGPGVTLPILENTSFMNNSFAKRNTALLETTPDDPTNVNTSFIVRADDEGLENDWKAVEQMMAQMPDNEDEHIEGLFGFEYHGGENEADNADGDEEATEVDPNSFLAPRSNSSTPRAKSPSQSFLDRQILSPQDTRSPTPSFGNCTPRRLISAPSQSFTGIPKDLFKQHKRTISGSSAVSDDLPPTEPSSPTAAVQKAQPPVTTGLFGNSNVSVFGSFSGFGTNFGSDATATDTDMPSPPVTVDQDTSSNKPVEPSVNPFAPPRPFRLGPNVTSSFGGSDARTSGHTSQLRASTLSSKSNNSNRPIMNTNASFGGVGSGPQTPAPPARRSDPSGNNPPAARTNGPSLLFPTDEEPAKQDKDGDSDMPDTESE